MPSQRPPSAKRPESSGGSGVAELRQGGCKIKYRTLTQQPLSTYHFAQNWRGQVVAKRETWPTKAPAAPPATRQVCAGAMSPPAPSIKHYRSS